MKLYEIQQVYEDVINNAEDFTAEQLESVLEAIQGEFDTKVSNIACLIKNELGMALMIENEYKELKARADSHKKKAEQLKEYLFHSLERAEVNKWEDSKHKISFKKCPPKLVISDEEKLMQELENTGYIRVKQEVDKTLVKKAIQQGEEFSHCCLEQEKAINIK